MATGKTIRGRVANAIWGKQVDEQQLLGLKVSLAHICWCMTDMYKAAERGQRDCRAATLRGLFDLRSMVRWTEKRVDDALGIDSPDPLMPAVIPGVTDEKSLDWRLTPEQMEEGRRSTSVPTYQHADGSPVKLDDGV